MSEQNEAFSALNAIASKFGEAFSGLPAEKKIVETRKLISFAVLGREYVIPLGEVSEILALVECTKLPRVKSWVKGVANVRGRLLPVVDFAAFLGGALSGMPGERRIMVLDAGGVYVGLMVDRVFGMKTLPVDQYEDTADDKALNDFIDGQYMEEGEKLPLFRPLKLIQDRRFMSVSA